MRSRLLVGLALLPIMATAQTAAIVAPEPMPLRASATLSGVRSVYDVVTRNDGGVVALVRIADHTGIVWLDASWKESRRVEFRGVRNGEMTRMVAGADGGFLAALETTIGGRETNGLRVIDRQGALKQLMPLSGPVTALHALPGGDALVAAFVLQDDGDGVTSLLRVSGSGAQRWHMRLARAQVHHLTVATGEFFAAASDPLAERHDRVIRGSLDGTMRWDRPLPWDATHGAAVARALESDATQSNASGQSRARHAIVAAAAQEVAVFATGGLSFERFIPVRYGLTRDGAVTSGPILTPVREAWARGRLPYAGWAPTAFPTGVVANSDGSYTLAMQYQDADGEGYAALARVRADGATQRVWWAVTRDRLVQTSAGWVLVQAGREQTQISQVDGLP